MFVSPMLPERYPEPFDDERYLFEPKLNGRRLILSFINQKTTLYNQHRYDVTRQYPELCRIPLEEPADVVFDGEVVYFNPETGQMEPETVVDRYRLTREPRIREAAVKCPLQYFIFDLLYYNGKDLRAWPLMKRKQLLARLLTENDHIHPVSYRETAGMKAHELARRLKLDGIVAKRKDSVYIGERSSDWLTVPRYEYMDAVISGYRKHGFGWLLASEGQTIGLIEGDVERESRNMFQKKAQVRVVGEDRNYVYLEPELGIRVRYRGLSRDGLMRSPEFVAFFDK